MLCGRILFRSIVLSGICSVSVLVCWLLGLDGEKRTGRDGWDWDCGTGTGIGIGIVEGADLVLSLES